MNRAGVRSGRGVCVTKSFRALLTGLVDYAGLFPPAKLEMQKAVESFARDSMGAHAWVQGRFICPATRLEELSEHAASLMPGTHATSGYREHADMQEPWRVSVVCDTGLEGALDAIDAFNARHSEEQHGRAQADSIEIGVQKVGEIDEALDVLPDDVFPYFEVPVEGDCRGFVTAVAGNSAAAKIRCGGITPDAFPSSAQVAAFVHACADAQVAFKATAGLHHPVRGEYPLTYEANPPRGVMHGYVNVFLAAALVSRAGLKREQTAQLLEETEVGAFEFTDDRASWRGASVDLASLAEVRERFALSYGSCSFDEPVGDANKLGWL